MAARANPKQVGQALENLRQLNRRRQLDPAAVLFAYVGTGDNEHTLASLEKAYSQHSNALTTLNVDPIFDPLRSDSRFQELVHRVGLAQ